MSECGPNNILSSCSWFIETTNSLCYKKLKIFKIDSENSLNKMSLHRFASVLPHLQQVASSTGYFSSVNWWWLKCLNNLCTVEAKYFCAVAVNCRPSYLNFLLHLRKSCPDEPLKHRNIGKIPQLSHILWLNNFSFKMNAIDDALFSGT